MENVETTVCSTLLVFLQTLTQRAASTANSTYESIIETLITLHSRSGRLTFACDDRAIQRSQRRETARACSTRLKRVASRREEAFADISQCYSARNWNSTQTKQRNVRTNTGEQRHTRLNCSGFHSREHTQSAGAWRWRCYRILNKSFKCSPEICKCLNRWCNKLT